MRLIVVMAALGALAVPAAASAAAPPNDNYLASSTITSQEFRDSVDTADATTQADLFNPDRDGLPLGGGDPEPTTCGPTTFGKTVWWDFDPPSDGSVEIRAEGGFDVVVAVYEWDSYTSRITRRVGCQNDTPDSETVLLPQVRKGVDYTVQVGGAGATGGPTQFALSYLPAPEASVPLLRRIRTMRRRLARRARLVRARSRVTSEIHAVLMRCLKDRPPAADLVGVKGRAWLAEQQLPLCERETVDAGLRQVDFLDSELAQVEQLIAADALGWPQVKRLMTIPGVNVTVAATFMAAVGDIHRFPDRRKLTAYLGLDPRVRQSGSTPANHGHIAKQGPNSARHALVEACWSTVRQPGPIAAFYARVKARRGHSIAIVASRASSPACSGAC